MSVDASFVDQIWRPDVFFVDSREQNRHSVVTDNLLLDIKAQFHTVKYHPNHKQCSDCKEGFRPTEEAN